MRTSISLKYRNVARAASISLFALAAFSGKSLAAEYQITSLNFSGNAADQQRLTIDQFAGAGAANIDHWVSPSGSNFGGYTSVFDNLGGFTGLNFLVGAVNGTSTIRSTGNNSSAVGTTADSTLMRGVALAKRDGGSPSSMTVNTTTGQTNSTFSQTTFITGLGAANTGMLYDVYAYHAGGNYTGTAGSEGVVNQTNPLALNAILSTGTGGSGLQSRFTATSMSNFDSSIGYIEGTGTTYVASNSAASRGGVSNYVKFLNITASALPDSSYNTGGAAIPITGGPVGVSLELNANTMTKGDAVGLAGIQLVSYQPTWKGGGSNIWTTADTANFTRNSSAAVSAPFTTASTTWVRFDDNAGVNSTINPDAAGVTAGRIDVSNSLAHPLTISGTGAITGTTAINKSGDGSLTLGSNANSFTGKVKIEGGSVNVSSIGSANGIGDVPVRPTGWLVDEVPIKAGALGESLDIELGSGSASTNSLASGTINYSGPSDMVYRGIVAKGGGATVNVMNASSTLDIRYFNVDSADVTKTGAGTLIFRGGSFGLVGKKIIAAEGTLLQNNEPGRRSSGIGAEALSGGTFGGTGSMNSAAITIRTGGAFKPGIQGSATYANDVDFEARASAGVGSVVVFETGSIMKLDLLNTASNMTSSTHLAIDISASTPVSTLKFNGTLTLELANPNNLTPLSTDKFFIVDGTVAGNYIGTALSGENVSINLANSGFAFANPGFAGNVVYDNNDIYITGLVAVPEPSTIATLLGGIGTLVGFRRLGRRKVS